MKLFYVIAFAFSLTAYSQDPLKTPIIPLTPNAASLGKFGDIPIGLYTGQPNISIPLYQIEYPNLSVPINLVYSYNGLKVEEYPGWVGTGWTLTGTGVINRQQRSLPDESINGYNGQYRSGEKVSEFINSGMYINSGSNATQSDLAIFTTWTSEPQNADLVTFLSNVKNGQADSEPDMFVFNIPGYSGKFFFDHTQCGTTQKTAVVLPHQNVKIKGFFNYAGHYSGNISTGTIESFEITDELGNKYLFDQLEVNEHDRLNADTGQQEADPTNNTWYLTEITDVFGNQVLYSYSSRTIDTPPTIREELMMPFDAGGRLPQIYYSKTTEAVLERIDFRNGSIDFVEQSTPRSDWNSTLWFTSGSTADQPHALEFIRINFENNPIREYHLEYGYFGGNARLRLNKVTERNGIETKKPYVFSYIDYFAFPRIGYIDDLFSQDHWGYYTGTRHSTLLPPYSLINSSGTMVVRNGNARTPSPTAASAGLLTKLEYPTGGFTEFEYEPNEYNGDLTEIPVDFNICSGEFIPYGETLTRKLIASINGSDTDTTYHKIKTLSLPTTVCARVDAFVNVSGCSESFSWVKLISTSGQVYIHVGMHEGGEVSYENALYQPYETFTLPAGSYELHAGVNNFASGCPTPAYDNRASIGLFIVDPAGSAANNTRLAGGMRVQKVVDCASSPCSGCTTKYFNYSDVQDPLQPSGRLITTPKYVNRQKFLIGVETGGVPGGVWVNGDVLSSSSNVPVVGSQGSTVGYKYVTVTEETDDKKGKTVHHFTSADEYADEGSLAYPFPPRLDNDWKRGAEVSTSYYKSPLVNDEIISSRQITNQFTTMYNNSNKPVGLKLGNRGVNLDANVSGNPDVNSYIFEAYTIESGWKKIVQEVNTTLDGGKQFETVTLFSYQNPVHLRPTEITTTASDGNQIRTTYKYKGDVGEIAGLTTPEVAGINALPDQTAVIEEKQFRNNLLISSKLNLYQGAELRQIKQSLGGSPLEEKINVSAYDLYGNILSYTTNAGIRKSYVYGYRGAYPVAEVINANSNEIYTNSFEENGGVFSAAVAGMNYAKSGQSVHAGGSFTMTGFAPPNPAALKMSYWYWNGSSWVFSGEIPYTNTINSPGSHLDEIRVFPTGSLMTTYTYEPGKGVSSRTDPNNITNYFQYDDLGRLYVVKDNMRNILSAYQYYYKN